MGQLANLVSERTQGALPSNTEKNPKEHVKAVTLRNGRQLEEPKQVEGLNELKKEPTQETKTKEEPKLCDATNSEKNCNSVGKNFVERKYVPPLPYPQKLKKEKLDKQFSKFLDIFKKLHINIPFAEALS